MRTRLKKVANEVVHHVLVGLTAVGISVVGISVVLANSPPAGATSGPIRIGMIDSLTGLVAGAGTSDACGAEVAVDALNASGGLLGHKIDLTVVDDQSSGSVSAEQARKLTADGVRLFVGGSTGVQVLAEAPYFKSVGAFFTGGTTKEMTVLKLPYVDRINSDAAEDTAYSAKYLDTHSRKGALVMVGVTGGFAKTELGRFASDVNKKHFTKIDRIIAPATETNWTSYITKVKAIHPSAVFVGIVGSDQPVSWYREAYAAGLRVPQFAAPAILSGTVTSGAGAKATAKLISADTWVTYIKNKAEAQLKKAYAKFAPSISYCGGHSFVVSGKQMETTYSQVLTVSFGVKKAKSFSPNAIHSALRRGSYTFPSGRARFMKTGEATQKYYLYRINGAGNEVPVRG